MDKSLRNGVGLGNNLVSAVFSWDSFFQWTSLEGPGMVQPLHINKHFQYNGGPYDSSSLCTEEASQDHQNHSLRENGVQCPVPSSPEEPGLSDMLWSQGHTLHILVA